VPRVSPSCNSFGLNPHARAVDGACRGLHASQRRPLRGPALYSGDADHKERWIKEQACATTRTAPTTSATPTSSTTAAPTKGRVRRRLRDLCLRPRLRRQRRLLPPPRRRAASRPSTAAEHPRLAIRSIALAVILLAVGLLPPRRRSLGGESDDGWCSCARPGPVRRPHPAGFRRAARRPRNGTRWLSKDTGLRDMPTAGAPARQV